MTKFYFDEIAPLVIKAAGAHAVLIGGQAVAVWAEVYGVSLEDGMGFTSGDVDFQGTRADVASAAAVFQTRAHYPTNRPHPDPTNAGSITISLEDGRPLIIQVLHTVAGVDSGEVSATAVPFDTDHGQLRVIHPVLLMEAKVCNAVSNRRDDEHTLRQSRACVVAAARHIQAIAKSDVRQALRLSQRVFRYSRTNLNARKIYTRHQIDPFDAVRPWPELPKQFRETNYPQMLQRLADKRSSSVEPDEA